MNHLNSILLEGVMVDKPRKIDLSEKDPMTTSRLAKFDVASDRYYMDKMAHELYDFDKEQLRPYQESNNVIKGMFSILQHLYDITFKGKGALSTRVGE